MGARIQFRRGRQPFWTSENPILHDGEPGYEKGTGKMKIGDGVTPWNDLPYFAGGTGSSGGTGGGTGGGTDEDIPDLVLFYENGKV